MSFYNIFPKSLSRKNVWCKNAGDSGAANERVRKTASCRGSLTIEASLGLTVFLLFLISLCWLFLVMGLELHVQRALEQVGNEAAQYSYVGDVRRELLRLRLVSLAGEDYLERSPVVDGGRGLSLAGSHVMADGREIRLVVTYRVAFPASILGVDSVVIRQQCCRYGWVGDRFPAGEGEGGTDEKMVYVTESGEVFHCSLSCTYLRLSLRAVPAAALPELRNRGGGKYYPCERCRPTGNEEIVYITDTGTRFHREADCSAVTRNVRPIPVSQAKGMKPCSRCGGR